MLVPILRTAFAETPQNFSPPKGSLLASCINWCGSDIAGRNRLFGRQIEGLGLPTLEPYMNDIAS